MYYIFHIYYFISSSLPDLIPFSPSIQTIHSSDLSWCNTICIWWLCCVKILESSRVPTGLSRDHLAGPQTSYTLGPWSFFPNMFATTPKNKPSIPSSLFSRVLCSCPQLHLCSPGPYSLSFIYLKSPNPNQNLPPTIGCDSYLYPQGFFTPLNCHMYCSPRSDFH